MCEENGKGPSKEEEEYCCVVNTRVIEGRNRAKLTECHVNGRSIDR